MSTGKPWSVLPRNVNWRLSGYVSSYSKNNNVIGSVCGDCSLSTLDLLKSRKIVLLTFITVLQQDLIEDKFSIFGIFQYFNA